jgi:putative endonuclease
MTSVGETGPGAVSPRVALGRYGEELVARYLREQGMEVVERNWRCEHGEIDIVARDGPVLVVCEVKTRSGTAFGDPVEAVTVAKALRLRRLTRAYLRERGGHPGPVRVDVVGVLCEGGRPPVLRHVRGVGS